MSQGEGGEDTDHTLLGPTQVLTSYLLSPEGQSGEIVTLLSRSGALGRSGDGLWIRHWLRRAGKEQQTRNPLPVLSPHRSWDATDLLSGTLYCAVPTWCRLTAPWRAVARAGSALHPESSSLQGTRESGWDPAAILCHNEG
jgi:hypothetical protein